MSVTTLCGTNRYEIWRELNSRTKQFLDANHNPAGIERLNALDLDNDKAGEVLAQIGAPSLFAPVKLLIIHSLSDNSDLSQKFIDWLEAHPKDKQEGVEVIIFEPNLDGRSKLYKELKAKSDFKEFYPLKDFMLWHWLDEYVRNNGGSISKEAGPYLISLVGNNQQRLATEVDKLLAYNLEISKSTIDALVEPGIDSNTFDLAAAAFAGSDRSKALRLYEEQRYLGVEPLLIIGSLAWQLHLLALIKTSRENSSADEIAQDSGFNSWAVSKAMRLAESISYQDLVVAIDKLALIDSKSKSARAYNIDDALKHYLLSI